MQMTVFFKYKREHKRRAKKKKGKKKRRLVELFFISDRLLPRLFQASRAPGDSRDIIPYAADVSDTSPIQFSRNQNKEG